VVTRNKEVAGDDAFTDGESRSRGGNSEESSSSKEVDHFFLVRVGGGNKARES